MADSGAGVRSPFGKLLIDFRTAAGLSQTQLASRVNIATRSIAAYESPQTQAKAYRLPHPKNLMIIAAEFSLDEADQARLLKAYERTLALRSGTAPKRKASGFLVEGREHHIRTLERAWQKASHGTPQVVFVSGDSDIGKTSLIRHVSDEIAEQESDVMFAWGEANSWAMNSEPYTVIRRAMDHLLGAPSMAAGAPARYLSRPALLPEHIYRVMQAWPALNDVLVSASTMRDVIQQVPRGRQPELLEQLHITSTANADLRCHEFANLLVDLSRSWPIVLVLEDLQWAGTLTCQLLAHLIRYLRDQKDCPILLIGSYRHHDLHAGEDGSTHPLVRTLESVGSLPHFSMISMNDVLSPTNGQAFVKALVQTSDARPGDVESLASWILEQSSGHPLISQELLSHALFSGDATGVHVDKALDSTTATGSMVRQRLRHISAQGKRILDVAAVMGAAIVPTTIAAVLNSDADDVTAIIEDELMLQQGLLRPGPHLPVKPLLHTFEFVHTLFRDYIYKSLNATRRSRLHKQIATHLESVLDHGDTAALDLISKHLVEAEDWHGASGILHSRAQLHMGRLDWDVAQADLDIAAEYAERISDTYQFWLIRANRLSLMRSLGEYAEAIKLADRIFEHTSWNNWPLIEAAANHHLGEVYYDQSLLEKSVEHLAAAVELYLDVGEQNLAGAAEAMLSHSTMRLGQYDIARNHARMALNHVRNFKHSWVKPEAVLAIANCDLELGFYERAIDAYREAAELGRMIGKMPNQVIPVLNTALGLVNLSRFHDALELLEELLQGTLVQTHARYLAPTRLYMGYAYEKLGNLAEAKRAHQETTELRSMNENDPRIADGQAGLLRVAMAEGDTEKIGACLKELESGIQRRGVDGAEELLLIQMTRARAAHVLGHAETYERVIREAYATLMARADKLSEPEARRSYLESVPINAELVELYTSLSGS